MKVLGIGEIVLDKVHLLHEYPKDGEKITPQKVEFSLGGPVTAALILLSKLGTQCTMIASTGNDSDGLIIKKRLSDYGVDFLPHKSRRTKTNTVIVNNESGSRTIIKDVVRQTAIKDIPENLIREADIIVFDRHEPLAFDEVLARKRPETKIIVDPSTEMSSKTIRMLRNTDFPIIPIESLSKVRRYEGISENLTALYKIIQKQIIVTAGDKGSFVFDGDAISFFPAIDIHPIDTLGAGDIFRGAFSYGVLQSWELGESIAFANIVSGLQCTKLGNDTAIPDWEEIELYKKNLVLKQITIEQIIPNI